MKKFFLLLISIIVVLNLCVVASASEDRVILYVSPSGYNSDVGSIEKPLKTLSGARDRIRKLKADGVSPSKGFVVYMREGTYRLAETLEFTKEDSGTSSAPVVYRSYPGEKVTVTGERSIDKSFIKKADNEITNRIVDSSSRDKIYYVDLDEVGIPSSGVQNWYGSYSYPQSYIDAGLAVKTNSPSMEFVVNGELLKTAKYPNDGYIKVSKVIEEGYHSEKDNGAEFGAPFVVEVKDERIKSWDAQAQKTALMYGFWQFDWADQTVPLESINSDKMTIKSKIGSIYSVNKGAPFYVYNLLEEIDSFGESYIDREKNILYFYFDNAKADDINLGVLELDANLINFNEASFIELKDMHITGSRRKGINISGGEGNKIEGCEISNTSQLALDIKSPKSGISNSLIHDVNGGIGVWGGDFPSLTHGEIYVLNCEIRDYSLFGKTNKSAVSLGGVGNIVAFNEIHSAPHQAISYSGNDHKIYYNNIYDVVRETDDAAAIYGGLDWVGRGHEIYYNYIHDISYTDYTTNYAGAGAIYLDGGQCELYIKGNVIENVEGVAFWVNSGQDNQITNNIVINDDKRVGSGWRNRWGLWLTDVMKTADFSKNHCPKYRQAKSYIKNDVWRARYGNTLLDMIENQTNAEVRMPRNNVYKDNIVVNTQLVQYRQSGTEIEDTIDVTHNYVSDVSPLDKDYLVADSGVYNTIPDFEDIPFERMGRTDVRAINMVKDAVIFASDSPLAIVNGTLRTIADGKENMTLINSRSYVNLPFLAETLGIEMSVSGSNITLSKGEITIDVSVGDSFATLNGTKIISLDPVIRSENGVLVAPIADIAKIFEKDVFWNESGLVIVSDSSMTSLGIYPEIIVYLLDKLNVY